jgi:hypothetical protein
MEPYLQIGNSNVDIIVSEILYSALIPQGLGAPKDIQDILDCELMRNGRDEKHKILAGKHSEKKPLKRVLAYVSLLKEILNK